MNKMDAIRAAFKKSIAAKPSASKTDTAKQAAGKIFAARTKKK